MPLIVGTDPTLEEFVAAVQVWVAQVDGVNASERLQELSGSIAGISTLQPGMIVEWSDDDLPSGYLWCDGAAHSRATYANLFNRIGTRYGAGDNSTTFNVPDRRGRFGLGVAASGTGSTLGATGGSLDHTHTGPSHTHTGPSHTHGSGTLNTGVGSSGAFGVQAGASFNVNKDDHIHSVVSGATDASGTGVTGASGTGATGSANPAFIALHYIIKT